MKLGVATPIFDEEYLLPIFLEHYKFVDEITFFYDTDTTDNSLDVIEKHKKTDVIIQEFNTGEGMNDYFMINLLHEKLKNTTVDYTFCVDADELFFHKNMNDKRHGEDIKNYIQECYCDFYHACFYQMYPSKSEDKDIFPSIPIWKQRKFGYLDATYVKPCIVKKDAKIRYSVGKHFVFEHDDVDEYYPINDNKVEHTDFIGCHLNNINLEMSLEKRLKKRRDRLSNTNISRGVCEQYLFWTEGSIREEFGRTYKKLW